MFYLFTFTLIVIIIVLKYEFCERNRNLSLYSSGLTLNSFAGWQYRWFVLDDNAGLFSYYTSKEKMMRGVRRGCVRLSGAILGIDDEVYYKKISHISRSLYEVKTCLDWMSYWRDEI